MPRPATGQIVKRSTRDGFSYALRFRAYGRREYVTLGSPEDGWTHQRAERELAAALRDVDRGLWKPPAPVASAPADPTFHEFASDWFEAKRREIRTNTVSSYRNDLTRHLLPFFKSHRLSAITISEVDRYRASKVREGNLSPRSINMHLALLAQILEVAVEYGHLQRNPAAGRRRKLKAERPRPVHLDDAQHISAMTEAASMLDHAEGARTSGRRATIAVLLFAGLRAEEVGALRWRDVDLANGRLAVGRSKTAAGMREVDLLPILRDDLDALKTSLAGSAGPDDPVFVTSTGRPRDRHNVRQRVVAPVAKLADEVLAEHEARPLPAGLSPHKLRHTFASLLVALGNDPAYVMGQLGHTDPAFTLRVYTHMMRRDEGERDRLKALVNGEDWAANGQPTRSHQPTAATAATP